MKRQLGKVVFIVPYHFVPPKNGGHKAAYGFAQFLEKETELLVISSMGNQLTTDFNLKKVFTDHFYRYFSPLVGTKMFQVIKAFGAKRVILHQPFMLPLLYTYLKKNNIPFAVFVQNMEFLRFKSLGRWWWPLMRWFEKWSYENADHLFFIAETDADISLKEFKVDPNRFSVIPYGTSIEVCPTDQMVNRRILERRYGIPAGAKVLLFFGPQQYAPNLQAIRYLKNEIWPLLSDKDHLEWVICGGGMPENEQKWFEGEPHWHYLGFVKDIETVIRGSDLMLNPIFTGGGVKTKIIESIAHGTTVLSTKTGAIGVDQDATQDKLHIVPDELPQAFADKVLELINHPYLPTPSAFYQTYHWKQSVQPVVEWVNALKEH